MKERVLAVQQTLWILAAAAVVLCIVGFPFGENRAYLAAQTELETFARGFGQQEFERSLLGHAQAQGKLDPREVAAAVQGPGVPKVTSEGAAPVLPLAEMHLETLADVAARTEPTTLEIGVPDAKGLGAALAWRLSRLPEPKPLTLTSLAIEPADVSDKDLALEREVAEARTEALAAEPPFAKATHDLEAAENLSTLRRKWRAPWKAIMKADQARQEARTELANRKRALDDAQKRYEALAARAQKGRSEKAEGTSEQNAALAVVTLKDSSGRETTYRVPVAIERRIASLPAIEGASFAATEQAGLWDEVKNLDVNAAIEAVGRHFTWHYRYVDVGGMKLGGMTLLIFLPLVLPALLLLLLARIRRVSTSYNPFGGGHDAALPRVGFGSRAAALVVLVILPFAAALLCTISLIAVGTIPVLPMIAGVACLGLGAYVFGELSALSELLEAVVRSHSTPPPPKPST